MRFLGFFAALALVSVAAPAVAQVKAEDKALAQVLFDDARKLVQDQRWNEACAKFQESQRLDPGLGTMLYLADCLERSGRTASAWATFLEAASLAGKSGETRRKEIAEVRAKNLEGRLARVMIQVPAKARAPKLEIWRNGEVVSEASWDVAVPVDPGKQEFRVSAPNKKPWTTTLEVAEGGSGTLTVPVLEDLPPTAGANVAKRPTPSAAMGTGPTEDKAQERSPLAYVLGGAGIVGIGVGSYFGVRAITKNNQSNDECNLDGDGNENTCNRQGVTLRESARTSGTNSTIAFAVGGALLASGVVMYFLSDPDKPESARKSLYLTGSVGDGAKLGLGGAW